MKKASIKTYNNLAEKAYYYEGKYQSYCSKIMDYIVPLINIEDDYGIHVFSQDGDGIVLSWSGRRGVANTPVDSIISRYNELGRLLVDEDLLEISI